MEMVRAPVSLAEDQGSILSPHMVAKTVRNFSSKGSSALFWPPQVPSVQIVPRHKCRQITATHKQNHKTDKNKHHGVS